MVNGIWLVQPPLREAFLFVKEAIKIGQQQTTYVTLNLDGIIFVIFKL
jgi:hypothetical protein